MSSFIFSDCATSVPLTETASDGKRVSTGSLTLTVRNVSAQGQVGTLSVRPDDLAQSGWFRIAGAPPTSPARVEIDCDANAAQTVKVDLAVPEGAPPGQKVFTLRIATERDPDNDFSDSPAVAFTVAAAPPPKVEPKPAFPWWIAAVAAAIILAVGGWMAWRLLKPDNPCAGDLVLRDAFPEDLVCVKPDIRAQVKADNADAGNRILPNAQWGPKACKPGFVWRVARPEDLVCVTPDVRTRTEVENKSAPRAKSR